MKTYYFNTGVRPYDFSPPVKISKGEVLINGVKLIPFDCEGVPEGAVFKFACDHTPKGSEHLFRAEIHNSQLLSKYAFFEVA